MDTPKLEIQTTRAQLEITQHRAQVSIRRRRPVLNVMRKNAVMRIDRQLPTLRANRDGMDQMLYRGPVLLNLKGAYQSAFQEGLDAIGRIAGDGTLMMQIESGADAVAQLARQGMGAEPIEINTAPLPTPEIEWQHGTFTVEWEPSELEMKWDVSTWAEITVEPHYVQIRLKKHPDIKIKVHFEHKEKRKVDEKI